MIVGNTTIKTQVTTRFIDENTVLEKSISSGTLFFTVSGAKSVKCPNSEILTNDDPEIPQSHIIKPE